MFFVPTPVGDCLCGSPPLWAIAFDVHLRACVTHFAHGVGSYKNPSLACHPSLDAGSMSPADMDPGSGYGMTNTWIPGLRPG